MISIGMHFESGQETTTETLELDSGVAVLTLKQGEASYVDLFFPSLKDCVRVQRAFLECPGCRAARPEVEAAPPEPEATTNSDQVDAPNTPMPGSIKWPYWLGVVPKAMEEPTQPQPAVQAMDAVEEWEMPF